MYQLNVEEFHDDRYKREKKRQLARRKAKSKCQLKEISSTTSGETGKLLRFLKYKGPTTETGGF